MRCSARRPLAGLIAGLVAVAALQVEEPRAAAVAGPAARLLQLINGARAGAGMAPVGLDPRLNEIAQSHAQQMASQGRLFHNASFPSQAVPWTSCGENVGAGPDADSIHGAFMSSAQHRGNILNRSFNLAGIGVATWSGKLMVVEDFVARSGVASAPVVRASRPRAQPSSAPPPPPQAPTEPSPPPINPEEPTAPPLHAAFEPFLSLLCQGTSLGCLVLLTVGVVLDSSKDAVAILSATSD